MAESRKQTSARPAKQGTKRAAAKKATKKASSAPRKRGRPKTAGKRPPTKAAKAAAEKVAKVAKDADAVGNKLTASQRQLRDSAIVARRAAGWTQEAVAVEFGVSTKQVSRIEAERGKAPSGLDERPMEILEALLRSYRQDISDARVMADRYSEKHPSAAVGAMRLARETHTQYIQLLMALGKLPTNLELFRSEAQMQRIAEEMVEKLEAFVRGDVDALDVLTFFRSLLPEREREVPQLTA